MSESSVGEKVAAAVGELRKLLADVPTEELVGQCIADNLRAANEIEPEQHLSSPARQQHFLLSIFLATPEPLVFRHLSPEVWERACELLQEAFFAYMELYFPDDETLGGFPPGWREVRQVAMSAFLHYFNTGLLASSDQVERRIRKYIAPFDESLKESWGLSATEAVQVAHWIRDEYEASVQALVGSRNRLELVRTEAELLAHERGFGSHAAPGIAKKELDLDAHMEHFADARIRAAAVRPSELSAAFGLIGARYADKFFVNRGNLPGIDYPTEEYAWDVKSGVYSGADRVLIPSANALYTSILEAAERELEVSAQREAYLSHRDRVLEDEVHAEFRRICPSGKLFRSTFETPTRQFEHDLIVVTDELVLLVEAKASPPIVPFRDPDRAFQRLQHAFGRDTGIQGGFEQSARIRRRLQNGEDVTLYDESGSEVVTLEASRLSQTHCVCATRDDFGPLATCLNLLLQKEVDEPYPWVVNVVDLDSMSDAWQYLGWTTADLAEYLQWRVRCHGKAYGSDELEYLGYHLHHGSLYSAVTSEADYLQLDPGYSDFFDDLWRHLHFDGPAPRREVIKPVIMDLRKSLAADEPTFVERPGHPGRNDPCPCRSGKKFKKCCGKPTEF